MRKQIENKESRGVTWVCESQTGLQMDGLREAIESLRGACNRLQDSVVDIHGDIEVTNKRLSSALRRYAEASVFFENILSSIPCGVVVVDTRGTIALINPFVARLMGCTADEAIGKHYMEIFKDVPERLTPLYTLASGYGIDQEEKTLISTRGERIPIKFSTSLVSDESGSIIGATEVISDLRRIKLMEQEIERSRKLATIGEFAGYLAHEIRNPLGGIKGFATLLARDLGTRSQHAKMVQRMIDGIEALERIVNNMLEAGTDIEIALECVDLVKEVNDIIEVFEMATRGEGKSIAFEVSCDEPSLLCRVDRYRIRQAITNLVRNSVEAVGEKGWVRIELNVETYSDTTGGMSSKPNQPKSIREYICIDVADSGPGVPDDLVDNVFAPLFTTKQEGMGLGLSLVRRVAALHGGEVKYIKDQKGRGRFRIWIPRR